MNVKKYSFVVGNGEISDINVSGSDVSTTDQVEYLTFVMGWEVDMLYNTKTVQE